MTSAEKVSAIIDVRPSSSEPTRPTLSLVPNNGEQSTQRADLVNSMPCQADAYLARLVEGGSVTFQTFADDKTRPGAAKLSQVLHGDLATWGSFLRQRNAEGAGVFVMVNAGDGKGRTATNVTAVRALFVDLDGSPLAPVLEAGLEPHIVVESSPRRWHAYWLVTDCPLDQFKPMQQALAAKFNGDKAVCDLPRVMRLPGFLHQKDEPFETRIEFLGAHQPFTLERLRTVLDLQPPPPEPEPVSAAMTVVEADDGLITDLRSALATIPSDDRELWVRIGLALKTLAKNAGYELWMRWSATSMKHQPAEDAKTWRSFAPTNTSYKVVFTIAAEHGWQNPAPHHDQACEAYDKLVSAMKAIPDAERLKNWPTVAKALHWETVGTSDERQALGELKAWCAEKANDCDRTWTNLKGPDEIRVSPIAGPSIYKLAGRFGWKPSATPTTSIDAPWEPPENLIASTTSAPYPLDALPGGIGAAVREVVGFVQCPPALAACSALSALSLAAQAVADVQRSEGLTGPISLYVLAVAESGERKSSCDKYFTSTIQAWQRERIAALAPDVARSRAKVDEWTASHEGLINAVKGRAKSGKATDDLREKLEALQLNPPPPVFVPFLIYSDATPEALAYGLAREWPSGGVMSAEAGAVFGGHAMTSDSAMRNMSLLNALWSGEEVSIKRRTSDSFNVHDVRLTMGLAVQPETIRAFFESSKGLARGIGFSARCLVAWPESTQGKRTFRGAPDSMPAVSGFGRRLGQLLDATGLPDLAGRIPRRMLLLSVEAQSVWRAFHDDVERELGHRGELVDVRDVASKAADNAARIAALFHLYEPSTDDSISVEHMRAATAIMTWHLYEARRFYGEIALPKGLANAVKLNAWLMQQGVSLVPTRLVRQYGPNALRDAKTLEDAVGILAEARRARIVKDGNKKVIQLNPSLVEDQSRVSDDSLIGPVMGAIGRGTGTSNRA